MQIKAEIQDTEGRIRDTQNKESKLIVLLNQLSQAEYNTATEQKQTARLLIPVTEINRQMKKEYRYRKDYIADLYEEYTEKPQTDN